MNRKSEFIILSSKEIKCLLINYNINKFPTFKRLL